MHEETISYQVDSKKFIGQLISPDQTTQQKRPAILVAHAWMGRDDFALQKAKEMAELGYIGFAVDLYGEGKVVKTETEATSLMIPLFLDRQLLQKRILAAYEVIKTHPLVDAKRIGGIGFCFGGMTIIELLRSGADVKGVVSFHGLLGSKMGEHQAKTVPIAHNIKGSLLILHGYDDPLVSQEDIRTAQKEFNDAQIDWQMHTYGHTSHAFTNPKVNDLKSGLIYSQKATKRSWQSMRNFFEEIL